MRFREFIYQPEDIAVNQGDVFDIELDNIVLETVVSAVLEDGVLVEMDAVGLSYLTKFQLEEAEYQGRSVPLGKPMKGDVKKSKVYVKGPSGRVVKVNFGDKTMKIKKSNPARRKSFRARHNCANPGPRHKARYWSCRAW
jgi:hypothetical protein